jgi:hypothetical protein
LLLTLATARLRPLLYFLAVDDGGGHAHAAVDGEMSEDWDLEVVAMKMVGMRTRKNRLGRRALLRGG